MAMKQECERFFNSELPYLLTVETGRIHITGWGFQLYIWDFENYRRLHLQQSISGIGAWPSINSHLAGQPHTQNLQPLFRVRNNQDWPNLRHTRNARQETGCGDHCSTVYWSPRRMSTNINLPTNYAEGTRAMENRERFINWERMHGEVENSMGITTKGERVLSWPNNVVGPSP